MRMIEAHYELRPEGPVAHYTTATGLVAILHSRALWATHIRYLNDASEFIHAVALAKTYLSTIEKRPDNRALIESLDETLESMEGTTWVVSFSEDPDLLSQWRAYCSAGGYSLLFSREGLEELSRSNQLAFAKCVYDRQLQEQMIAELVSWTIAAFPKYDLPDSTATAGGEREKAVLFAANWFFPKMLRLASLMKDPAFREEREWRLVAGLYRPHITPDYHVRGALVVPHRTLRFPDNRPVSDILVEVKIGPGSDPALAQEGLFFLRQREGIDLLRVTRTEVPYRPQ